MKIDIVGAGAIGLLFGGGLALAGNRVRFWTRTPEQARALREKSYVLENPEGTNLLIDSKIYEAHPLEEAERIPVEEGEKWIFITTKQRHVEDTLIKNISHLVENDTEIACFQNGVGHLQIIQSAFPEHPVFAVITTEGAKRTSGHHVIRAGKGMTKIGIPRHETGGFAGKLAESLVKKLIQAGFPALLSNQIDKEIYEKLLVNAVINPLTALLRIPNGGLLETEERKELMLQLYNEAAHVYQANDIDYDPDMYERIIGVCRSTSGNMSSMLKDVMDGSPTEIDYINGRIVEMARIVNVPVPGHETLWRLIRAMNRQ